MNTKTTFAVAAFTAIAAMAGTAFAATDAPAAPAFPCEAAMTGAYAELAQSMRLTGPAKSAFDKYVNAREAIAAKHHAQMLKNYAQRPASADEAIKLRAERLKSRAAMLEELAAARATLEKSLTAEQKEMLDAYEPRFGMGAGMGRGMGPCHHRGYGPGYGMGPGCAGGPGCVYGTGTRGGDGWGWHGPRHGYGMGQGYGYGPGCRW